jgi:hypothetical protein
MHLRTVFSSLITVAGLLATSATSLADHRTRHWVDRDHDGHANWKGNDHHDNHHYSYYRYPYYGGYYGGWGWYRPYYWYPRTSIGLSFYDSGSRYSRYSYADNLAADVQRALRSHGYYGGPIDGDIGSGSRAAIRNYQRDHGLGVTGRIDTALLRSLRVG